MGLAAAGVMIFSGCGSSSASAPKGESKAQVSVKTNLKGKKSIVVYYSDTGNTKLVADEIGKKAGADVFRLELTNPYTKADLNYMDSNSRVSREHDDVSLRNNNTYTSDVKNWDSYEVVFLGYPIWWGEAAWTLNPFVRSHDFQGKTVIPFATSHSSGLGQSAEILKGIAGTGNWEEGMRFGEKTPASEVDSWLAGYGY